MLISEIGVNVRGKPVAIAPGRRNHDARNGDRVATLEIITGPGAGQRYEVTSGQTLIGRDPFCDVVLPARSISRQHARILSEGDQFYVEDLHSLNGTFVNGRKIGGRTRLIDHDRLQLYEILMTFYRGRPEESEANGRDPRLGTAELAPEEDLRRTRATTIVGAIEADQELAFDINARARLQAILEIIRNLGRSLQPEVFLPNVLDSLFEIFPQADRGYVLLNDATGQLVPQAIKQRRGEAGSGMTMGPISRSVASRVLSAGEAILSTETQADDSIFLGGAASTMTAPLVGPSRLPLGILHLESSDSDRHFVRDDLEVLLSVGTVTGQAVEYARIHATQLEFDRRQRELATAREVQLHFLPRARPEVAGYQFFDHYQAAQDVGGDYFGYLKLPDGRLAIALGDVSGKGVSAALLMARLCSDVRYCLAISDSAAEAMGRLNRELAGDTLNDRFVTFLLCVIDTQRHTLEIVNAGHPAPLLRRGGLVVQLGFEEAGQPLGLDPTREFVPFVTSLEPADIVLAYTDGISEARSESDVIYGTIRLCNLLGTGPCEVQTLAEHLLDDVAEAVGSSPQSDDICLLAFGRDAAPTA